MINSYHDKTPSVQAAAFIAQSSDIAGDVKLGKDASVWFNAVLRADVGPITIGARSNIQDGCIMHVPWGGKVVVGDDVTVGHRAVVHGCTIGNRVLVGMGSIIMDDAIVEDDCIIGAGAVITPGSRIPSRSMVLGVPAKVVRELTDDEVVSLKSSADNYAELAKSYGKEL
jgi:carbonic anhydrase/acetyltransferase-like protein (isoleucine patch superfamily)